LWCFPLCAVRPRLLRCKVDCCCTQDACDIADADHTQQSLENWDRKNITALALLHVSHPSLRASVGAKPYIASRCAAVWQGLRQEFIDKTFKGLFPTRKIARELLPLLKPKVEHKACEGPEGKSEKTCDELGEELLVAGRKEDVAEVG
jgi:hypothetical protein